MALIIGDFAYALIPRGDVFDGLQPPFSPEHFDFPKTRAIIKSVARGEPSLVAEVGRDGVFVTISHPEFGLATALNRVDTLKRLSDEAAALFNADLHASWHAVIADCAEKVRENAEFRLQLAQEAVCAAERFTELARRTGRN